MFYENDKFKHGYYSFVIVFIGTLLHSILCGILAAVLIGIVKEAYDLVKDYLNNKPLRIKDCFLDLLADTAGILLWVSIYCLLKGGIKLW